MGLGDLLGRAFHEGLKIVDGQDTMQAIGTALDTVHAGDIASGGVHGLFEVGKALAWTTGKVIAPTIAIDNAIFGPAKEALSYDVLAATGNYVSPEEADKISPGRALNVAQNSAVGAIGKYSGINTGLRAIGSPFGMSNLNQLAPSTAALSGQLNDPNFDITDKAQADKVFDHGFGKFQSGVTDASVDWYLDPLARVGKVASAVRATRVTVAGATRAATKGKTGEEASAALQSAIQEKSSVERLADEIAARPAGRRMGYLASNPMTRGVPGLNPILDQLGSREEILNTLAYTHDPTDINVVNRMRATAEAKNQVDTLLGKSTDLQREIDNYPLLATNGEYPAWVVARNAARNEQLTKELDLVTKQYGEASKKWGIAEQIQAITDAGATGKLLPRVTVGGKLQVANAWANFQPGRLAVPLRVAKSATSWAPDEVQLSQPGHPTEMARRMMARAGHAAPISSAEARGPLERLNLTSRGMAKGLQTTLLGKVAHAETLGPQETIDALQEVEAAVLHHEAGLRGIEDERAAKLYEDFDSMKTALGKPTLPGSPEAPRFSGTKHPTIGGATLDQVLDDHDALLRMPVTSTQLPNVYKMMPIDALAKVLNRDAWAFRAENGGGFAAWLRGQDRYLNFQTAGLDSVFGKITHIMTSTQLMRAGYIIRNNTDQGLRMIAAHGILDTLAATGRSVTHAAGQSKPANLIRDFRSRESRAEAAAHVERLTGNRALSEGVDATKSGLVDKIHATDNALSALDPHLTAAGDRLRTLGQQALAERVYLTGPDRTRFAPGARGTRFEVNPPTAPPATAGHVVHERHIDAHWRKIYETESGHADPGIAALSEFVNEARFTELGTMPVAKLRETIAADLPGVKLGSLRTRDDLMSAYGAQLAKRRGHDAIRHTDISGTESFTDLTGAATRPAQDAELVKAADELQRLHDQRDLLTYTSNDLKGNLEGLGPSFTDHMNTDLAHYQDQALSARERRSLYGKDRPFAKEGDTRLLLPNGQMVRVDGPFKGAMGQLNADATSNRTMQTSISGGNYKYTQGLRNKAGNSATISATPGDRVGYDRKRHILSYKKGYEDAVNRQLATDPIASRLMAGQHPDEVLHFLENTPQGRKLVAQRPDRRNSLEDWIGEIGQQVDSYLPTDRLRAAALQGRASVKLMEKEIPNELLRPTVHGESLDHAVGSNVVTDSIGQVRDAFFQKLAAGTTDMLTNHPYAYLVYRNGFQEGLKALKLAPHEEVTAEQMDRIHAAALRDTQASVKRNMYDLTQRSNLASAFRFASPYYAAWQEALVSWSRLILDDPSRFERLLQLYQMPSKAGYVHTDANGNQSIITPLPDSLKKQFHGLFSGNLPMDAITGTIAQGKYFFLPSAGAPVSIPVSVLVRSRPPLAKLLEPIVPFGVGKDIVDDVLPADLRRLRTLHNKEDDPQYAQSLLRNNIDLSYERNIGKNDMTDDQIHQEAIRRTNAFWGMRAAANALYPAAPTFTDPKYQYYYDQARMLQAQYQNFAQRKLGDGTHRNSGEDDNGKRWEEAYIDKFGPDFWVFTASASKSNVGGVMSSKEGYNATKKYADMLRQHPDLGSLIVGDEDKGAYDPSILQWQQRNKISPDSPDTMRSSKTPTESLDDAMVNLGWDKYRQFNTAVTTLLASRGLKSINAAGATDIKAAKDNFVAGLEQQYPAWKQAYGTFTAGKTEATVSFMESAVDDHRFVGRAGWGSVAQYLAMRRNMVTALAGRKSAGGSANLQASDPNGADNSDLRGAWEDYVGGLVEKDLDFADLWYRWLQNDHMTTGGAL